MTEPTLAEQLVSVIAPIIEQQVTPLQETIAGQEIRITELEDRLKGVEGVLRQIIAYETEIAQNRALFYGPQPPEVVEENPPNSSVSRDGGVNYDPLTMEEDEEPTPATPTRKVVVE